MNKEIARHCKRLLKADNAVIMDTETTGLGLDDISKPPMARAQIIEIAVVTAKGETLLNQRIKPTVPVERMAYLVHGISNDNLALCPHIYEVYSDILWALKGRRVICYNAPFDRRILTQSLELWNLEMPDSKWHCLCRAFKEYAGLKRFTKLGVARTLLGCDAQIATKAHTAIGDCQRTLELLQAMAEERKIK